MNKGGVVFLVILFSTVLSAQTHYADSGDDLNLVENELRPGDSLILNAGTYSVSGGKWEIVDASDGTEDEPIIIQANGEVWVRPRIRVLRNYFIFDAINVDNANSDSRPYSIDGHHVTVRNAEVMRGHRNGIDINNHDVTIENCVIHDFDGGDYHGVATIPGIDNILITGCIIYDCEGDCIQIYNDHASPRAMYITIENCELYTTRGSGSENAIDIKDSRYVTVRNCTMRGFRDSPGSDGSAVVIHNNADDILVEGCTIYDSHHGIRMGSESDNVTVQKCIFYEINGGATNWNAVQIDDTNGVNLFNCTFYAVTSAVRMESTPTGCVFKNNILYDCVFDLNGQNATIDYNLFYPGSAQGGHPVEEDPQFVNAAGRNFYLQVTSPAIDQGTDVGLPFYGSAPDLGAKEYEVDETAPTVSLTHMKMSGTVSDNSVCPAEVNVDGTMVPVNVSGLSGSWVTGDEPAQSSYSISATDASGNTGSVTLSAQ